MTLLPFGFDFQEVEHVPMSRNNFETACYWRYLTYMGTIDEVVSNFWVDSRNNE